MIEEINKANTDWEGGPPSPFSFERTNATINDGIPNTSRALQNLDQTRIALGSDSMGRNWQLLSAFVALQCLLVGELFSIILLHLVLD